MSSHPINSQIKWITYPTVKCDNQSCRSWNDNPTPGTKCFKCCAILPTWAGYLNNNSAGNILEETQYYPPPLLERNAYQEYWNADEIDQPRHSLEWSMTNNHIDEPIDCTPLKLKRTDGDADQEEEDQHITNAEIVIKYIMSRCKLDREGAINKLDKMTRM